MKWREDLNEIHDLGDKVRFVVFAEGENIGLSIGTFPENPLLIYVPVSEKTIGKPL